MSKTLHQKLTSKTSFLQLPPSGEGVFASLRFEERLLSSLSSDLLQPRWQAVNALLEMARAIPQSKEE